MQQVKKAQQKSLNQQEQDSPELEQQENDGSEKPAAEKPAKASKKVKEGPGPGLMNGSRDDDGTHPFPENWSSSVVVWQCQIAPLGGGIVEIPNTHSLQTYSTGDFDKFSNAEEKEKTSFFSEAKMKVVVLHDPRD